MLPPSSCTALARWLSPLRPSSNTVTRAGSPAEPPQSTPAHSTPRTHASPRPCTTPTRRPSPLAILEHGPHPFACMCAAHTRSLTREPSQRKWTTPGPSDVTGPRLPTAHTRESAALTLRPSPSGHPRAGHPANPCSPELMHCARALAIPLRPSSSTVTRAGSPAEPSQSTCANAHRPSDVAGLNATTLKFRLSQRPAPSHRATPTQSDHGLQTEETQVRV